MAVLILKLTYHLRQLQNLKSKQESRDLLFLFDRLSTGRRRFDSASLHAIMYTSLACCVAGKNSTSDLRHVTASNSCSCHDC